MLRLAALALISLATVPLSASQFSRAAAAGGALRSQRPAELLVFAGKDNQVFLGCLTCSEYDPSSIHNALGSYGSKYSLTSILNPDSDYGSQHGPESACNPYALKAPVIMNRDGKDFGQLTVNKSNRQRTKISAVLQFIAAVCGQ